MKICWALTALCALMSASSFLSGEEVPLLADAAEISSVQKGKAIKETLSEQIAAYGKLIAANAQVIDVTDDNFDQNVAQSKLPVILDVYATWCGACKSMEPTFRDLSAQYQDSVRFVKVNYDESPEIVQKYNVTQLPTFLFIYPGQKKPAMRSVGGISKSDFETKIDQFLKKK